jgi:DNA-binding NtrC family response regulator
MVDTPIAVEPPPSDPEAARVDPPVVLVVDDEEFVLRALQRLLRPRYEVLTAACPSDALKLLEAREVQIVMSDQRMPETSGVEFLARVRALYPNSVRILFTGYADVQAAIETINLGKVYGYISKPWDPQQLELMLAQALEHHRLSGTAAGSWPSSSATTPSSSAATRSCARPTSASWTSTASRACSWRWPATSSTPPPR